MPAHSQVKPYENLYLNADQADVWFVIDNERIPGHKLILSTAPWFKTMFSGSLPEQGDVNLSETATASEFREFLQFFYLHDVHLTADNIDGVLNLSKQSMVDEFFQRCEQFLLDHITIETMCHGLQLAILYDAKRLEQFCERAISINAVDVLKSEGFLNASYELVDRIIGMPTLLSNEKVIFDACMNWAQANAHNQTKMSNETALLRDKLQNLLYQIRIELLSDQEFGGLLHSQPELFTKEEIQEMIFIRTQVREFTPKYFTARPRSYRAHGDFDDCNLLACNRFIRHEKGVEAAELKVKRIESTIFSSNRSVLLRGFSYDSRFGDIKIECIEKCSDSLVLPSLEHTHQITHESEPCDPQKSNAKFHLPIVIEPNQRYELRLELQRPSGYKRCLLRQHVELDQDIRIEFYAADGRTDATRNIIHTLFFHSLNTWPTKLLLRQRQIDACRVKRILRQTCAIAFNCMDAVLFLMSLIM